MSSFVELLDQELHRLRERLSERALELQEANARLERQLEAAELHVSGAAVHRAKENDVLSRQVEQQPCEASLSTLQEPRQFPKEAGDAGAQLPASLPAGCPAPTPQEPAALPLADAPAQPPAEENSEVHEATFRLSVNSVNSATAPLGLAAPPQRELPEARKPSNSQLQVPKALPETLQGSTAPLQEPPPLALNDPPELDDSSVDDFLQGSQNLEPLDESLALQSLEKLHELEPVRSRHNSKVSFCEIPSIDNVSDHNVSAESRASFVDLGGDAGLLPGILPRASALKHPTGSQSLPMTGKYSTLMAPAEGGCRSPSKGQLSIAMSRLTGASNTSKASKVFKLLDRWSDIGKPERDGSVSLAGAFSMHSMQRKTALTMFDDEVSDDPILNKSLSSKFLTMTLNSNTWQNTASSFIILPSSGKRFAWDVAGFMLIGYDAAVIPLQFFQLPNYFFFAFCNWITRLFWTFDILLSFMTGYLTKAGSVEVRCTRIAKNYLLSWALPDFTLVAIDWLEVAMSESGQQSEMASVRVVKIFKFLRAVRMLRLLKLIKVPQVLSLLTEEFLTRIRSEKLFLLGGIVKVLGAFLIFVHFIACFWYFVGASRDVPAEGWVHHHHLQDETFEYKYMTSFHWSLAQFAGSTEIVPCDFRERTYTVIVLLMAWIISAIATSIITTAMTRDSFLNIRQSMENVKLRRFMLDNGISKRLAARLLKNVTYISTKKARTIAEEDLELLKIVSEPLRMELHYEIHGKVLSQHPFFVQYEQVFPAAMRKLCHHAIELKAFSRGDVVFSEGEAMDDTNAGILFVRDGSLKYHQDARRGKYIDHSHWLCEASMFTMWTHVGDLRGKTETTLARLTSEGFHATTSICFYESEFNFALDYAEHFVGHLNQTMYEDLTDLGYQCLEVENLVNRVFRPIHPDDNAVNHRRSSLEGFFKGRLSALNVGFNIIKKQLSTESRFSSLGIQSQ